MNKKNIWIINQYTGGPKYGMNYRSYYLAKEFLNFGHKVTIFSGSYSHLFSRLPLTYGRFTKEQIDGIDFIWVKTPKYKASKSLGRMWNMLVFMFQLFTFKTHLLQKPDVIIISSLSLFPIINAYLWSKKFRATLIFEIRDLWPQTLIELGNISSKHPLIILLGFFEKFGYRKSDYIVSLLENSKDYMQSRGMSDHKFCYIPNGINLEEVKNSEPLQKNIIESIPKDKFIVGYLGTIGIANALEYFIEAAQLLQGYEDIHFIIVGKGGEKIKIEQYVKKNGLENITFIEPILKSQVQSMLSWFDICYIGWHKKSIYKYGISANKLFDYMYSKRPILHSIDISNDIVQRAKCGLTVAAEDSKMIANGIVELKNMNTIERKKMGKNGKEYVLNYHTYDKLAKKFEELF